MLPLLLFCFFSHNSPLHFDGEDIIASMIPVSRISHKQSGMSFEVTSAINNQVSMKH
jgi:hypothetical protein